MEIKYSNHKKHLIKRSLECQKILRDSSIKFNAIRKMYEKYMEMGFDYKALCEWVEKNFEKFSNYHNGDDYLEIKVPYVDKERKDCYPVDALLLLKHIKTDDDGEYDEITCTKQFNGKRLEWDPKLLLEILENQDTIGDWCEEFKNTYQFKEKLKKW